MLSGSNVFVFVLLNIVVLEEFWSTIQDRDDEFKDILEFFLGTDSDDEFEGSKPEELQEMSDNSTASVEQDSDSEAET